MKKFSWRWLTNLVYRHHVVCTWYPNWFEVIHVSVATHALWPLPIRLSAIQDHVAYWWNYSTNTLSNGTENKKNSSSISLMTHQNPFTYNYFDWPPVHSIDCIHLRPESVVVVSHRKFLSSQLVHLGPMSNIHVTCAPECFSILVVDLPIVLILFNGPEMEEKDKKKKIITAGCETIKPNTYD